MPDSSELLKHIVHYQKSLDRYSQSRNDTKLLHCIFKLNNMPITVSHLTTTGVGRTVNSLRKLGGDVADAANTLVAKWKQMVSGKDDSDNEHNRTNESDTSHTEYKRESESNSSHKYKNNERRDKSSKNISDGNSKKDKYDERNSQGTSESTNDPAHNSKHRPRSKIRKSSESGIDSSQSDELSSSDEKQTRYNKHEYEQKYNPRELKYREPSTERNSKHKRESSKEKKRDRSRSKERERKHESRSEHTEKQKRHSSSLSDSNESSDKYDNHRNVGNTSGAKRKYDSNSSDEESQRKVLKKSSSHDTHRSLSSHKSKESTSNRNSKKENKHESSKKESKYTSSKTENKSEKKKHDSHREESSKSKEESKKESSSKSDNKSKDKSKSKHSSKSSSSSNGNSKKTAAPVAIGFESGTSFAEALGMLEPTTSKATSKKSRSLESSYRPEKPFVEKVAKEKWTGDKSTKMDKVEIIVPPPPPKVDLDINIASLLPAITPNYRPVANPFLDNCNSRSRIMNDDEALSMVMSQKNLRTKVYSGNKCFFGNVPTLFELCIRILQDNIDALEYTGGVPYSILKPILDKATPDQLFTLEHHNPYLIEDTDDIWHFHCQKEFRNKKREELESWREMYMRCLDEREAKLKALTENIKLAQDKSIPVRQTKLAYVDSHSVVKPPRDVIRKQVKNGIDKKPAITPSSRLNATSGGAAVQVSAPTPVRASSSGGSSAAMKPKKAPLMQKTLALLKGGRFRR